MPSGTHSPAARRSSAFFVAALLAALALIATACRVDEQAATPAQPAESTDSVTNQSQPDETDQDQDQDQAPEQSSASAATPSTPPSDLPRALLVDDIDCTVPGADGSPSGLTDQGEQMFSRYLESEAAVPTYQLAVDIDPRTGRVAGAMRAVVPTPERTLNFRAFAGMDAFNADLTIRNVSQNGEPTEFSLDRALLSIPADESAAATTLIELDFSFAIDQMAANEDFFSALSGDTLQPDQVGLLGRTSTGMQLGHWFPVWLPDGVRTDPDPSGFGDIGAFPTANICATVTAPAGYQTVTGGSRVNTSDTSVTEAGVGLRDFAILISNDLVVSAGVVNGVEVRVWGPTADLDSVLTVLDYAKQSQRSLTNAFGPYPWTEVDLVSAPLGGGVGGMEWPGMIWIEQSMFAGGLPGMGQFGDLFDDEDLGSILGSFGGEALTTTLEWTIAHELGHEWWHATVGNDSIASPAVDEPLAQFAACIAMIDIHPDNWREICEAQTTGQFAQARSLGIADAAAEQPSDAFDSSIQYGAIVYGKAPGFYLEAADLIGWDELIDALGSFVAENAFDLVSTDELRSHLVSTAGADGAAVGALWDRWFRQARGDEDIEASNIFESFGLNNLEGLDLEGLDLEGLDLEGLDGVEGLDFEELFEGLEGLEGLDLDELLGENSELFEELLEGLTQEGAN